MNSCLEAPDLTSPSQCVSLNELMCNVWYLSWSQEVAYEIHHERKQGKVSCSPDALKPPRMAFATLLCMSVSSPAILWRHKKGTGLINSQDGVRSNQLCVEDKELCGCLWMKWQVVNWSPWTSESRMRTLNAMANERQRLIHQNPHVRVDMEAIKLNVRAPKLLHLVDHNPVDHKVYQNLIIASYLSIFFTSLFLPCKNTFMNDYMMKFRIVMV